MRRGNYEYSVPFALGQVHTKEQVSTQFHLDRVNSTPMLVEFAVSGVDPSGSRHLITHPSFEEVLASGRGLANINFGDIDMKTVDIGPGSGISCTKVFLFRIDNFDCVTSRVTNMRVWASDTSDFLTNTHTIIFETSQTWQQNKQLPITDLGNANKTLPESLPIAQNLLRQDGGFTIYNTNDDHVSEWVYTAVSASGSTPLGEYGGQGAGNNGSGFRIRTTYDLDNLPLRD
jgi:hypothetical protein